VNNIIAALWWHPEIYDEKRLEAAPLYRFPFIISCSAQIIYYARYFYIKII
jgi:hypothetical protein